MPPTLAYPLREKLFAGVPFPDLHPEPLERLSHELRIQLRLYGANRYSDLPACEILAQDTLLWLDMEVCFSAPLTSWETSFWKTSPPSPSSASRKPPSPLTAAERTPSPTKMFFVT